jgi:hypothetical protein
LLPQRSIEAYLEILSEAGFEAFWTERHDDVLAEISDRTRRQLFTAEILVGLGKLTWRDFDFRAANAFARLARSAIQAGDLGYAIVVANKGAFAGREPIKSKPRSSTSCTA